MRPRLLRLLVPFVLALAAVAIAVRGRSGDEGEAYAPGTERQGRLVLVLVDSLTDRLAEDPGAFPTLAKLRARALWGRMAGCLPASTVTCARTLLEGSNAGYVAGLRNFSATRAGPASWPVIAAEAGMRLGVASDHTLINMCEGLGGPRLHYAAEKVPVYRWDEAALERARDWIRNDVVDAALIHLVDLDKVSHSPGPHSRRYRDEVLGADRVIAEIASLLGPRDTLIVLGDHGHDEIGNHTPDPGYLAVGPAFVPGRLDLDQASTALLLSAAAGTPLPRSYSGDVPSVGLRQPFGGSEETRQRVQVSVEGRQASRHEERRRQVLRFLPGLALALLALVAVALERKKWLPAAAVVLAAAAASWVLGLVWASHGRPLLWQGPARNVLHYFALLAVFLIGASVFLAKTSSLDRAARVGAALLAFPLLLPLIGNDYFSSTTALARFFVPALALLLYPELRARSRWAFAAVAAAAGAIGLILGPLPDMTGVLPTVAAALLGGVAIGACAEQPRRVRTGVVSAIVLLTLGGPMRFGGRATLALALLAVATACFAKSAERRAPAALPLVGASAIFLAYWGSLQGLWFEKVRFEFVFSFLPPIRNEAIVAAIAGVLTPLKYGLLPWIIATAAPALASVKNAPQVVGWFLLSVLLHAAWVAGAALDPASRYDENGIQAACLLAALALVSIAALALRRRRAA